MRSPRHAGTGAATAAARNLLGLAWANGARRVIAHSAAERNASNRVMGKLGMRFVEALPHAELGTWRFVIDYVPSPDVGRSAEVG